MYEGSGEGGSDAAPSCKALLELPPELLQAILLQLRCGVSLARCEEVSCAMRAEVTMLLWRAEVLRRWGWLLRAASGPDAWKSLFVSLHTGVSARFRVIGGCQLESGGFLIDEDLSCAFAFDPSPRKNAWSSMPVPLVVREMAAVVRIPSGDLVALGGTCPLIVDESIEWTSGKMRTLQSVECFDGRAWSAMAPMSEKRCCSGAAVDSSGVIYAVGGGTSMYRGATCLRSVERFQVDGGTVDARWLPAPPMLEARCGLGVAISHETDRLFAFGGYAGAVSYLDTCESLPVGGSAAADARWTALPRMSCPRAGPCADAGPDGRLYVVGGGPDGTREWKTMEALDPRTDSWQTDLAQLQTGRHYNAGAFGPDGRLYVSGAFRHAGQLDTVERYDPRADKWELLPPIGFTVKFSGGAFTF